MIKEKISNFIKKIKIKFDKEEDEKIYFNYFIYKENDFNLDSIKRMDFFKFTGF